MVEKDLLHLTLHGYLSGSSFCRQNLQRGGVYIFVMKDEFFNKSDHHFSPKDEDSTLLQNVDFYQPIHTVV
jgi:hypothetical protein